MSPRIARRPDPQRGEPERDGLARALGRSPAAALRAHAAAFAVVNGLLVVAWGAAGTSDGFWPGYVLAPTAVVLAAHAAVARHRATRRRH